MATVSRVLSSAKKQKQILKEGFKAFSCVFEFRFYDTYEQSYFPFCVPIHFRFKLERRIFLFRLYLKQGALGILATVSRVLTSAKKQKQILKEGFKAFSWVFEFCFYDTCEQSYLHFHGLMHIKLPMHH